MFCYHCGRTLAFDAEQCPICGAEIKESMLFNANKTSCQPIIMPGDEVEPIRAEYTRINYTSDFEENSEAVIGSMEEDARTTYRPTYEETVIPDDVRENMRAYARQQDEQDQPEEPAEASAPAEEIEPTPEEVEEAAQDVVDTSGLHFDMDMPDLSENGRRRSRTISAETREAYHSIENSVQARNEARSSRRRKTYGDYTPEEQESAPQDLEQDEVFDNLDEEAMEEMREGSFGVKHVLQILAALIVLVIVVIGAVIWVRYIRGNSSSARIESVRETFYDQGLTMIKTHAESSDNYLEAYTSGGLGGLAARLSSSSDELDALIPADATEAEQLYLKALKQIETNIANCVTSDALAISTNDTESIAASDSRWAIVTNSIAVLESATNAVELTAIINGEQVEVVDPSVTPTPTPMPNYNTLSKGDKSDAVYELQTRLFELGFFQDARDGAFGGKTQTAIKMFQQEAGLQPTGIADSITQARLYAEDAPRTVFAQSAATTDTTPEPAAAEPTPEPQQ